MRRQWLVEASVSGKAVSERMAKCSKDEYRSGHKADVRGLATQSWNALKGIVDATCIPCG